MTKLSAVCFSALLLALAAVTSIDAYTVMHYKTTTWSLAANDRSSGGYSVPPAEMMNPLAGYAYPGVPQRPAWAGSGGICGPGMNCGQAAPGKPKPHYVPYSHAAPYCGQPPYPPPWYQAPAYSQPESSLWY